MIVVHVFLNLTLQANQNLQRELAKLRQSQFSKPTPSGPLVTPPVKRSRYSDISSTAKVPRKTGRGVAVSDDDDDDDGGTPKSCHSRESSPEHVGGSVKKKGNKDGGVPQSQEAKEARLRRLCETKPSGKCWVTKEVHDAWARGGASRAALLDQLESVGFNKAPNWLASSCFFKHVLHLL